MKRWVMIVVVMFLSVGSASAQSPAFILEIIKAGIVKVIKAVDLKIQRLQNETIWLQNAQKVMENTLSKLRLEEIAEWSEKQRVLYADYFDELYKVKNLITVYDRVREATKKQLAIIDEYRKMYALFRNDIHFTAAEILSMERVYESFLSESLKNLEQIRLVLTAYNTQMTDEKRLEIIDRAADNIDQVYSRIHVFNASNFELLEEKTKELKGLESLERYHGIK